MLNWFIKVLRFVCNPADEQMRIEALTDAAYGEKCTKKKAAAENAAAFPDTKLTIQEFNFRVGRFGGDFGPVKLGGVWFVSKEGFKKIKIGDGDILNMQQAQQGYFLRFSSVSS